MTTEQQQGFNLKAGKQPRPAGRGGGGRAKHPGLPAGAERATSPGLPAGAEAGAEARGEHPLFLTFTSYGTWLHGDERGSYLRKGKSLREHFIPPSPELEEKMRARMKGAELRLDEPMRRVVDGAIREHCAFKKWRLHALNVRTNHVHCVVSAHGASGTRVLNEIKSWATRALRASRFVAADQPVWTRRGSIVILDNESGFLAAVHYVLHEQ